MNNLREMLIKYVAKILLTLNSKYDLASDNYPEKSLGKLNIELFVFCFMVLFFYLGSKKSVLNLQNRNVQCGI